MKVRYSAVNGGAETEVKISTSCIGDDSDARHDHKNSCDNNSTSKQQSQASREEPLDIEDDPRFGGKKSEEQTTIDTPMIQEAREYVSETEGEAELDSVFEDETGSQQISHNRQKQKHSLQNKRSRTQEVLFPVQRACCCRHNSDSQSETWCSFSRISKCHSAADTVDLETLYEKEPLRKRAQRACFTFIYIILATVAVLATYSMVNDLVVSVRNPVRSVHYKVTDEYRAPGQYIHLTLQIY